jgi:hypothetical protein
LEKFLFTLDLFYYILLYYTRRNDRATGGHVEFTLSAGLGTVFEALLSPPDGERLAAFDIEARRLYLLARIKQLDDYSQAANIFSRSIPWAVNKVCSGLNPDLIERFGSELRATGLLHELRAGGIRIQPAEPVTALLVALAVYQEGGVVCLGDTKYRKPPNKLCQLCGHESSGEVRFCTHCGNAV